MNRIRLKECLNLLRIGGVCLLASAPAHAGDFRGLFKAGFDFGGDTLETVTFRDGTTETIKANEGFYVAGGVAYIPETLNLETELTVGWKYTGVTASNGELRFTRYPLEALVFYPWEFMRFGGGLTYHINPTLERDGAVVGSDEKYDNAVGLVGQVDYRLSDNVTLGVRYTMLEYSRAGGDKGADGFGINVSGRF